MKYFDIDNYQRHLRDLKVAVTDDPFLVTTYMRGAFDIANSFPTDLSGTLSRNDIIQECYYILCKTWDNLDLDAIRRDARDPQAYIWHYLKETIKPQVKDRILAQRDGVRIPHYKVWELIDTKDVDDFLSQLFPTEWFAENDETLDLIDYGYNTRYDIEQLGLALQDVFLDRLSKKEADVIELSYGLDGRKLSTKKIGNELGMSVTNVTSTANRALSKLRNQEVKDYLKEFYEF